MTACNTNIKHYSLLHMEILLERYEAQWHVICINHSEQDYDYERQIYLFICLFVYLKKAHIIPSLLTPGRRDSAVQEFSTASKVQISLLCLRLPMRLKRSQVRLLGLLGVFLVKHDLICKYWLVKTTRFFRNLLVMENLCRASSRFL